MKIVLIMDPVPMKLSQCGDLSRSSHTHETFNHAMINKTAH